MEIQARQRDVVTKMFHWSASEGGPSAVDIDDDENKEEDYGLWKVLVFDKFCQDVLAPLLSVADLRKQGVTLHLPIGKTRQRVADVAAVYFVRPTEENIKQIYEDCSKNLYDSFYLNFSSTVPQSMLESLAKKLVSSNCANKVKKVMDQYVNFVSLEPRLFSLNIGNSFIKLNHNDEKVIMGFIDHVADGLNSVFVTMGVVPHIVCRPGEASQFVASKLSEKLYAHLQSRNNLFASTSHASFTRPVLILSDRTFDISVPLHHAWGYQALVHDLLHSSANRVTVNVPDSAESKKRGGKEEKSFDLDSNADEFWQEHAGSHIPQVAEAVEAWVREYTQAMEKLGLKGNPSEFGENMDSLSKAVDQVPALTRKKRLIDLHSLLATALLNQLTARRLQDYFAIEEDIICRAPIDRKALQELIGPNGAGTLEDKMRTFLIYCAGVDSLEEALVKELERALLDSFDAANPVPPPESAAAGPTPAARNAPDRALFMSPFAFLKKFKFARRGQTSEAPSFKLTSKNAAVNAGFSLFGQLVDRGRDVLAGVRTFLPANKDLPLTKFVDSVMDGSDPSATANLMFYDPKVSKDATNRARPQSFKEAVVFVVGGGNYVEFQNLREYVKKTATPQQQRSIVYGSTEMVSPLQFVQQLSQLGRDRPPNSDDLGLD